MTLAALLFALVALIAAPGPSNTLMGLAGARDGLSGAARLVPALVAGYLCAVLPVALAGGEVMRAAPQAIVAVRLCAAAWVLLLAVRLWRLPPASTAGRGVSARQVWLTTLLNPKALVVALALLPAPGAPGFATRLALFVAVSAVVAMGWAVIGARTTAGPHGPARLIVLQRVASVWLAAVSAGLAVTTLSA